MIELGTTSPGCTLVYGTGQKAFKGADAVARLPKSNQQLIMSAIPLEPVHQCQGGRSGRILCESARNPMLAGVVGALEGSAAGQEELNKLQESIDRNIMSSERC